MLVLCFMATYMIREPNAIKEKKKEENQDNEAEAVTADGQA